MPLPLVPARVALGATARRAAGPLMRWSVGAQRTARRNAMVASTALARRRAERDEVEQVVAAHWDTAPSSSGRPTSTGTGVPSGRIGA